MGEDLVPDYPLTSLRVWAASVSASLLGTGNEELYDLLFATLSLGFGEYVLLIIHFSVISLTLIQIWNGTPHFASQLLSTPQILILLLPFCFRTLKKPNKPYKIPKPHRHHDHTRIPRSTVPFQRTR